MAESLWLSGLQEAAQRVIGKKTERGTVLSRGGVGGPTWGFSLGLSFSSALHPGWSHGPSVPM